MRRRFLAEGKRIEQQLLNYTVEPLLGLNDPVKRDCFIEQVIDSKRRIEYFNTIQNINIGGNSINPSSQSFDPLKTAVWYAQNGNIDESAWLLFLSTHFGKHRTKKWRLLQAFYNGLGSGIIWNWQNITTRQPQFQLWLNQNHSAIKQHGSFGNHRKYETLNTSSIASTHLAIQSYLNWVGAPYDHSLKILPIINQSGNNPRAAFEELYKSLTITRFGRMAKFDFLSMIGKVGLMPIEPNSTYMVGATGPVPGARLLFGGATNSNLSRRVLESKLSSLEGYLNWRFGMQILEDALCNWQKSPTKYIHFAG